MRLTPDNAANDAGATALMRATFDDAKAATSWAVMALSLPEDTARTTLAAQKR